MILEVISEFSTFSVRHSNLSYLFIYIFRLPHLNFSVQFSVTYPKIKLPKLGLVSFAKSKKVTGRILSSTIRKNPSGKYFVSVLVETDVQKLSKTNSACGIDLGLKDFAILSDKTVYENPKFFRALEEKLAKEQRILSRRVKFSSNWNKQRIKVARVHERIVNSRNDYLHKISAEIVKNHDIIGIEDLQVSNMLKNQKMRILKI